MMTELAGSLQDIELLIGQVSKVTGLETSQISEQISQANIPSFQYNDLILVSPEDFDPIIDAWADSIKQELNMPGGKATASKAKAPLELDEPIDEAELVKPSEEDELTWPSGYEKIVTHLYTPTLKKILPEDPEQRQRFLEAIAQETETGQRLVDELARAIVKKSKRSLGLDRVKAGLKSKCAALV